METTTIQLVSLMPSVGMHLRNKVSGDIAEGKVYLPDGSYIKNFEEVSEQVYQEWLTTKQWESEHPQPEPPEPEPEGGKV